MSTGLQDLAPSLRVFERGWLSSNNILLCDSARAVLIDSGYASHAEQTLALIRHALGARPLDLIVNTHLHSDHCGGNALLQQHYGCQVAVPAPQAEAVRDWDQDRLSFRATGQLCQRFACQQTLAPGQRLELGELSWQVLAAPGHDPHSLMLYCRSARLLISADALWENGFGVIFPELDGASGFAEQQAVLELIAGLDVAWVIPGHGAPFQDVAGALTRATSRLAYWRADPRRHARNALKVLIVFKLLEARSMTAAELADFIAQASVVQTCLRLLGTQPASWLADLLSDLARGGAVQWDPATGGITAP